MLIFSAIVPHPPLLIPAIGKENFDVLKKTKNALEEIANHLYALKPDTIIIISPHGDLHEEKITINQSPEFVAKFDEFGDLITKIDLFGDMELAYKIYEKLETTDSVRLVHDENLDHGASVPLFYILKNLPETKILSINYSLKDIKSNFGFGEKLAEIIHLQNKRIAVIASGDLSHSSDGKIQTVDGKKFDKMIISLFKEKKYDEIINLDKGFVEKASECGLRSIAVLIGIIKDINLTPKLLSYECPLGVGYAVVEIV
jgi:AmmeMemoRadiSam system protein B